MKEQVLTVDYSILNNAIAEKIIAVLVILFSIVMIIISIITDTYVWIGYWVIVAILGGFFLTSMLSFSKTNKNKLEEEVDTLNYFLSGGDIYIGKNDIYQKVNMSKGYNLSNDQKSIFNENILFDLSENKIKMIK